MSWQEFSTIGLWHRPKNSVFYGDTSLPAWPMPPDNLWQTLDLSEVLPCHVGQVILRVWSPIQRPAAAPAANAVLTVAFRAPGDTSIVPAAYAVESMCSANGSGIRQQSTLFCPVIENRLEWCWTRSTQGAYPPNCSYGVNIELLGYVR